MTEISKINIESFVLTYLEDNADPGGLDVNTHTNFVKTGLLDSFSILSMILFFEKHFKIKFSVEELSNEGLQTVDGLSKCIFKKVTQG